jgi:iron complex transport system substrate-binding protein
MRDNRQMHVKRVAGGFVVGAALMLTACAETGSPSQAASEQPASNSARPIVITADDLGPIPQLATTSDVSAPQRIVSLATGIGETLVSLGAGDRVVGRDEASAMAELVDVPVVTEAHSASAERVLALDPDLVLIDAASGPPEVIDQIRSAGITVREIPQAWTLEDLNPRTAAVAEAIGADTPALVESLPDGEAASDAERPSVAFLYLRGTSAIYLLGGEGSGADALIEAAGGRDVGTDLGLPAFTPLTAESLIGANPDVLVVMTQGLESVGGLEGLLALPGVESTNAARNRAVIAVDDNVLLSFGPRTPQLISELSSAITRVTDREPV